MIENKQGIRVSDIKRKKVNLYKSSESYAMITYKSLNCEKNIVAWNSTNRKAPEFIKDENSIEYKKVSDLTSGPIPNYVPRVGDYVLQFITYDIYRDRKFKQSKLYWNLPFVKKKYETFEDLLDVSCLGMKKEEICLVKVDSKWKST